MNDVEKKLTKYRAQKEREAKYNEFKANLGKKLTSYFSVGTASTDNEVKLIYQNIKFV